MYIQQAQVKLVLSPRGADVYHWMQLAVRLHPPAAVPHLLSKGLLCVTGSINGVSQVRHLLL
jgi:hypothetical protein